MMISNNAMRGVVTEIGARTIARAAGVAGVGPVPFSEDTRCVLAPASARARRPAPGGRPPGKASGTAPPRRDFN